MLANKTLLQMKYARIVRLFAEQMQISDEDALDFFYASDLYRLVSQGVADLHCRSDEYLADALWLEWQENHGTTPAGAAPQ
jgi:hypothetical protein